MDTVHKYSTDDPQLVHRVHNEIHKLSTIKEFSLVDRPKLDGYCRRLLARSGRYWHRESDACIGRSTGSSFWHYAAGAGEGTFNKTMANFNTMETANGVSANPRTPPQDLDAERSVLGAMMLSTDAIAEVSEILRPNDFYSPGHEVIYTAITDLFAAGEPADAITVTSMLDRRKELARTGGAAHIHTLVQSVPTAANASFYAEIVAEKAILRRIVNVGAKISQMGYSSDGEVEDIVNEAQAEIYKVGENRTGEDYVALGDILAETIDEIEAASTTGDGMSGVPSGFDEFDELTQGLHGGQMIVIAARPAVGKSTLGLDFARAAAVGHGMTTAFFSLEMSKTEIAMRLLSSEATISLSDLRKGTLDEGQWRKMALTLQKLNEAPFFIDDSPNMSMMEIRAKCRRLKQQHNLKMVVLDYLQLMSSGKRVESRQQEVSEFSRSLKLLAKELEVPVVALSQLNRGSEQRTDKRPQVSDLRESGSIEQDADMVILLHREDMYDKESPRAGEADLIVAKHRNGPTKTIELAFQGHYSRFANMAPSDGGF